MLRSLNMGSQMFSKWRPLAFREGFNIVPVIVHPRSRGTISLRSVPYNALVVHPRSRGTIFLRFSTTIRCIIFDNILIIKVNNILVAGAPKLTYYICLLLNGTLPRPLKTSLPPRPLETLPPARPLKTSPPPPLKTSPFRSRNPSAVPLIRPNYFTDPLDMAVMMQVMMVIYDTGDVKDDIYGQHCRLRI